MRGTILKRGVGSWRVKFDLGDDPTTGKRRYHQETVKGTKTAAQKVLAKRLVEFSEGQLVDRTTETLADYAGHWLHNIAPSRTSGRTRERYAELVTKHIVPHLGGVELQKLDGTHIDRFYHHLLSKGRLNGAGGLSGQTVQHIHRVLFQILASAVKARKLRNSPMDAVQTTPKVTRPDIQILDTTELAALLDHVNGRPLYMPVLLAASTGMRHGEILALRWKDIDLDNATLHVAQAAELVGKTITVKKPKSERSRRTVALPARLVDELSAYRKSHAEMCLSLGLGKVELVFPHWPDGKLQHPRHFTKAFGREVVAAKLPHVTFHGLRHTHITHLLRSGVPVHVVSARAGHANPSVTLNIYAHLLSGDQEGAAAVIDAALRQALPD